MESIMKSKKLMFVVAAGLFGIAAGICAADEPDKAEKLAMGFCGECHGRDGNAISPQFPKLAGQKSKFLETQMQTMRDRVRSNADSQDYMWGPAHKLDDETIKVIAKYYSRQKPSPGGIVEYPALAAKGKQAYEFKPANADVGSCADCHGQDAEGGGKEPRLAGQHRHYLVKQLNFVQANKRSVPDKMHAAVRDLSHEEIKALAEYLQSK
jgi:cytochrome c553